MSISLFRGFDFPASPALGTAPPVEPFCWEWVGGWRKGVMASASHLIGQMMSICPPEQAAGSTKPGQTPFPALKHAETSLFLRLLLRHRIRAQSSRASLECLETGWELGFLDSQTFLPPSPSLGPTTVSWTDYHGLLMGAGVETCAPYPWWATHLSRTDPGSEGAGAQGGLLSPNLTSLQTSSLAAAFIPY